VGEVFSNFFDNQTLETLIFRLRQERIVAKDLDRRSPGALH
jgi:hypothetical protein